MTMNSLPSVSAKARQDQLIEGSSELRSPLVIKPGEEASAAHPEAALARVDKPVEGEPASQAVAEDSDARRKPGDVADEKDSDPAEPEFLASEDVPQPVLLASNGTTVASDATDEVQSLDAGAEDSAEDGGFGVGSALLGLGIIGGAVAIASASDSDSSRSPAPTFVVTADGDGGIAFSGTASGDISVELDQGVATFSRGGVVATQTVDGLTNKSLEVASGQTLVIGGDVMALDAVKGVSFTGAGVVRINATDAGEGVTTELTLLIKADMSGGDLIFDMTNDDQDQITLIEGSEIDLGGGNLIISDGTVYAEAALLSNIGRVETNSTLVTDVPTLKRLLEANSNFKIVTDDDAVPGNVEILVRSKEDSGWLKDKLTDILPGIGIGNVMDPKITFTMMAPTGEQKQIRADLGIDNSDNIKDMTGPQVASVVSSQESFAANDTGDVSFTITFNEAMDKDISPELAFQDPSTGNNITIDSLELVSGLWNSDGTQFVGRYKLTDAGEEIPDIAIEVTGARDVAGNEQVAAVKQVKFAIDTVAPEGLSIDEIGTSDVVNGASNGDLVISGKAEADAVVRLTSTSGKEVAELTADENGDWDYKVTDAANTFGQGGETITAVQLDAAGNVSGAVSRTFEIDTVAPTAPVIKTADATTNATTQLLQGTAEAGVTVTLRNDGDVLGTALANDDGEWATTIELPTNGDVTELTLTAEAVDAAGNVSEAVNGERTDQVAFTIDQEIPQIEIVRVPNTSNPLFDRGFEISDANAELSVAVKSNIGDLVLDAEQFDDKFSGTVTVTLDVQGVITDANNPSNLVLTQFAGLDGSTLLADGEYRLVLTVGGPLNSNPQVVNVNVTSPKQGGKGQPSTSLTLDEFIGEVNTQISDESLGDTLSASLTSSGIEIVSTDEDTSFIKAAELSMSFTAATNAEVLTIGQVVDEPVRFIANQDAFNGSETVVVSASLASARGENTSTGAVALAAIDSTGPSIPIIKTGEVAEEGAGNTIEVAVLSSPVSPTTSGFIKSNDALQVISGIAEPSSLVTVRALGTDGTEVFATNTANSDGQWSVAIELDGIGEVTAFATDNAGNTSVFSSPLSYTVNADWNGDNEFDGNNPSNSFSITDVFSGSSNFSDDFASRIEGYNPATVPLTITEPLTVEQAVRLSQLGFDNLDVNVSYTIEDIYAVVNVALGDPDQRAALAGADEVVAKGTPDPDTDMNFIAFGADINLRIEAGAGDDIIRAGTGGDDIVGGLGADVITLTGEATAQAADSVIYETRFDGHTSPISTVTFSTDVDDYRDGSVLTLTINGKVYATAELNGGKAPAAALQELADVILDARKLAQPDEVVVGRLYDLSTVDLNQSGAAAFDVIYLSDLENGAFTVPSGFAFLSSARAANLGIISDDNVDLEALRNFGMLPGSTYKVGDREIFSVDDLDKDNGDGQSTVFADAVGSESASSVNFILADRSFLTDKFSLDATEVNAALYTQIDDQDVRDARVIDDLDNGSIQLQITGNIEQGLEVLDGSGDGGSRIELIENDGKQTIWNVDFSGSPANWPTQTNVGNTTEFERTLLIKITANGTDYEVDAGIVFDSNGSADIDGSINALIDKIESISGLKDAVDAVLSTGGDNYEPLGPVGPTNKTLVLTAKNGGEDSFSVQGVNIEQNGVQQKTGVIFSTDPDDYFEGGKLRAEVAGKTIEASMVEKNVAASVNKLVSAINGAIALDGTVERASNNLLYTVELGGNTFVIELASDPVASTAIDIVGFRINEATQTIGGNSSNRALVGSDGDISDYTVSSEEGGFLNSNIDGTQFQASSETSFTPKSGFTPLTAIENAIVITAATEQPDPLAATGELDFAGEFQQATFSLETATQYSALTDSTDVSGDHRGAQVYFEGGKVYLTLKDEQGALVTIEQEMVGKPATLELDVTGSADMDRDTLIEGSFVQLYDLSFGKTITIASLAPGDSLPTLGMLLDAIAALDEIASATIENNQVLLIGASGTPSFTFSSSSLKIGDNTVVEGGLGQLSSSSLDIGAEATAEALVQKANAKADGGKFDGIISNAASNGADITLTAANPGKDQFRIDDVRLSYQGVQQVASITLDDTETYTDRVGSTESDRYADVYGGGNAFVTITTRVSDGNGGFEDGDTVAVQAVMGANAQATATNLAAAINAEVAGSGSRLNGVIAENGAVANGDGSISLTAAGTALESFVVSDVRLDYAGITQLASVELDSATQYTQFSFDDGSGGAVAIRADARPDVYFEGGNVRLEITPVGVQPVVVTSEMVLADPARLLINVPGITTDTVVTGDITEFRFSDNSTGSAVSQGNVSLENIHTVADLLSAFEEQEIIKSATLTDEGIVITAEDSIGKFSFSPVGQMGMSLNIGVTKIGFQISQPRQEDEPGRYTTEALIDAINAQTEEGGALFGTIALNGASADGSGGIRLEAANPGEKTFRVSDIRLDYQGVQQIAEVNFNNFSDTELGGVSYFNGGELSVTIHRTNPDGTPTTDGSIVIAADMENDEQSSLSALVGKIQAEIDDGKLTNIVSEVIEVDGVITLVSADEVKQQFTVSAATATLEGEPEVVVFDFSTDDALYFSPANNSAGSTATLSVTVGGETFTVGMDETATGTFTRLKEALDSSADGEPWLIEGHQGGLSPLVATYSESEGVFTFTGATNGTSLNASATRSVDGELQVSTVDFSAFSGQLDSRPVSLSVGDEEFTSTKQSISALLADFKAQIDAYLTDVENKDDALVTALAPSGVGIEGNKLVLTGLFSDETFTVSAAERDEIVTNGDNDQQVVNIFLTSTFLTSADGQTVRINLGPDNFIEVSDSVTIDSIAAALRSSDRVDGVVVSGNLLKVTAEGFGPDFLGTTGDDGSIRVLIGATDVTATTNVAVEETTAGAIQTDSQKSESVGTVTPVAAVSPDLTASISSDENTEMTVTAGVSDTDETVNFTNPSDSNGFFGDAPQLGADGVRQGFVNPDDALVLNSGSALGGTVEATGGDNSFLGDDPISGTIDNDAFDGNGIQQGFTNPDGGVAVTGGSTAGGDSGDGDVGVITGTGPVAIGPTAVGDSGVGDATFFGDPAQDAGQDSGVRQSFTNPENGYAVIEDSPQVNEAGDTAGDDNLFGSDPGYYTDDGLRTKFLSGGTTDGNDADSDGNFLYIEDSNTAKVDVDASVAVGSAATPESFGSIDKTEPGVDAFEWGDGAGESEVNVLSLGNDGPDVVHNFQLGQDVIQLEGELAGSTIVGEVEFTQGGGAPAGITPLDLSNTEFDLSNTEFDLSNTEFGLVNADQATVADLGDADAVASLLNSLFAFGASDNGELNTSVFAITAADDDDVTAIWAHQQSSAGDGTVEAAELFQLALLHTEGEGAFGASNLFPQAIQVTETLI